MSRAFQRIFSCKIWRRYRGERALESLIIWLKNQIKVRDRTFQLSAGLDEIRRRVVRAAGARIGRRVQREAGGEAALLASPVLPPGGAVALASEQRLGHGPHLLRRRLRRVAGGEPKE